MVAEVRVYVEGGGDSLDQSIPLRDAIKSWLEAALPKGSRKFKVIMAGPRKRAYEWFAHALLAHQDAVLFLLVDAEECLPPGRTRWEHVHLRTGDGWTRPEGVSDDQLHFMATTMETWLVADPIALEDYFGKGFVARHLPGNSDLEQVEKDQINRALEAATRLSKRGSYRKGADFKLLGKVSPTAVQARCPHAKIFVTTLAKALR